MFTSLSIFFHFPDGLWDVMTSEEAGLFVRERLIAAAAKRKGQNGGGSGGSGEGLLGLGRGGDEALLESVAAELVKHAIEEKRSTDNVSVVIARLVPSQLDGGKHGSHPHPPRQPPTKSSVEGVVAAGDSGSRVGGQRHPLQERAAAGVATSQPSQPQRNILGFSTSLDSPEPTPTRKAKPSAAAAATMPTKGKGEGTQFKITEPIPPSFQNVEMLQLTPTS